MSGKITKNEGQDIFAFADLVSGCPRWEVCRRFLTCLMLTNQGNTDILVDSEDDRHNNFRIQLLDSERKPISLDDGEPIPIVGAAPAGRKRKSKSAALVDVPTPQRESKRGKRSRVC